ncbi:secreted RxLR effector protein 161-like protein [Tanacetum coccineum]
MIIAVYAPHDPRDKRMLWDYLAHVINQWQGEVVIMGDFNEVRVKSDRFGTNFNVLGANIFNSFINSTGLEEVHLGGASLWTDSLSITYRILLRESPMIMVRFLLLFFTIDHLKAYDFVTVNLEFCPSVTSQGNGVTLRYSSCPTRRHWSGVKQILLYLQGRYCTNPFERNLVGFADAGYMYDPHTDRSQPGYVFTSSNAAISWRSVKQSMSATSSNNAKILAIHEASQECVWLRSVIQHIRGSCGISSCQEAPTVVHEDNAACVAQLKDGYIKLSTRSNIYFKLSKLTSEINEFKNSVVNGEDVDGPDPREIELFLEEIMSLTQLGEDYTEYMVSKIKGLSQVDPELTLRRNRSAVGILVKSLRI